MWYNWHSNLRFPPTSRPCKFGAESAFRMEDLASSKVPRNYLSVTQSKSKNLLESIFFFNNKKKKKNSLGEERFIPVLGLFRFPFESWTAMTGQYLKLITFTPIGGQPCVMLRRSVKAGLKGRRAFDRNSQTAAVTREIAFCVYRYFISHILGVQSVTDEKWNVSRVGYFSNPICH